jgi:hypothetical protein
MKISELITQLINAICYYEGDVEVVHHGQYGGDGEPVEEVLFVFDERVVRLY